MDKKTWNRIEQLWDEVLELPQRERSDFIARIEASEPEVAGHIRELMEALDESEGFLEQPIQESSTALFRKMNQEMHDSGEANGSRLIDRQLGSYRILSKIADGGMSSVYLAERADGVFDQKVAIKLMRLGIETPEAEARFYNERQILASLNHPNIAQILDGGVYEDGTPYLVMEYIDGLPLDEYCRKHDLNIDERIRLFLTACDAVRYAHQNLVIHRDLKPNNIFVSKDGHVKLLDFGIAKILEDQQSADITRTSQNFLSVDFSAPEQVNNQKITTSTDLYSLGVTLYLLLTDSKPYKLTGASLSEIEQVITSQTVTRPSKKVLQEAGSDDDVSIVKSHYKKLKGDLDNIILKALEKESRHRYRTVDELTADLNNYLNNKPVSARRATRVYYLKKFIERNILLVASTLLIVTLLILSTFISIRQANIAAAERDRAQQEATKSEEVAGFLQDLFETGDPFGDGEDITLAEVIDRGAERITEELSDQPEVQAELMRVIGNVYHSLGNYTAASGLLEQSVEIHETLYESDDPGVAIALNDLGSFLRDKGELERAEALQRRVLSIRRDNLDDESIALAETLNNLAAVLYDSDQYRQSLPYYEEALEIFRANYDEDHPHLAAVTNNLANVYYEFNDFDRAQELYRETLEMDRHLYGDEHPYVATSLNNLGRALTDIGKTEEADSVLTLAKKLRINSLGESHPYVAQSYFNLAILKNVEGNYATADSFYTKALQIRRKELGETHPRVATAINGLALMHQERGDLNLAISYFEEAIGILENHSGSQKVTLANLKVNYANTLRRTGDLTASEQLLDEAITSLRNAYENEHADIANALKSLGRTRLAQTAPEEALALFKEADAIIEKNFGDLAHKKKAKSRLALGESLMALHRFDESDTLFHESIKIKEEALTEGHPVLARSYEKLIKLELVRGDFEEAEHYAHKALSILNNHFSETHWRAAVVQGLLGEVYIANEDFETAESFLTNSYQVLLSIRGEQDPITISASDRLSKLYEVWPDAAEDGDHVHSALDN